MNILVLGDSDTSGRYSAGRPWPLLVQEALQSEDTGPVTVTAIPFSASSATSPEYAAKKIEAAKPDVIVMVLGSFPFTAKFAWLRIEQLFGKRAGKWFHALEDGFDSQTRQKPGGRDRINRAARFMVPKVIGGKSFCTRKELTENYRNVFRTLARFEDTRILILSYPGLGAHARKGDAPRQRKVFFADMRAAADTYHYTWIDGVAVFASAGKGTKVDQLHFGAEGHELMAAAVQKAISTRAGRPA